MKNILQYQLRACLSEKIKFYRRQNNLVQKQFASLSKVSRRAIASYESKHAFPKYGELSNILSVLGITYEQLVHDATILYTELAK